MSSNLLLAGTHESLFTDWQVAAKLIDHTNLKPDATGEQVLALCAEAQQYGFCSVVVNPAHLALAVRQLRNSGVKPVTVVGFPLGATFTSSKLGEAESALRLGAQELDVVINIGALKSGDRSLVQTEIRLLSKLCHASGALLKVILENALLAQEEKILVCALAMEGGADFVKTSTGFADGGATAADVAIMRGVVGNRLGVKAAGGIRCAAQMAEMVEAGANRVGTSSGVAIVRELGAPSL